jgi:hypothetical protein
LLQRKERKKRDDSKTSEVVDAQSEHLLQLIIGVMNTLDVHKITGRYFIMDNVSIHKVSKISELIRVYSYLFDYLFHLSIFLKLIELLWPNEAVLLSLMTSALELLYH